MKIFLLCLWLLFIILEIVRNYYLIEIVLRSPDYKYSFFFRAFVAFFHAVLFNLQVPADWWPVLIFQLTSFWILFSPLLNILRDRPFWYLGKKSGWIDSFLFNRPILYKILYFACCLLLIISIRLLLSEFKL
jgi:hypothetical protein